MLPGGLKRAENPARQAFRPTRAALINLTEHVYWQSFSEHWPFLPPLPIYQRCQNSINAEKGPSRSFNMGYLSDMDNLYGRLV